MPQFEPPPSKVFRGTLDEVLRHRHEIPKVSVVELRVFEPELTPTMAIMKAWLEEDATDDPMALRVAEEELREFKRNMNLPRKETGARLLYPEAE